MRPGHTHKHPFRQAPHPAGLARRAGVLLLAVFFAGQGLLALAACQMFGPQGQAGAAAIHAGHPHTGGGAPATELCQGQGPEFAGAPEFVEAGQPPLDVQAMAGHCPFCTHKTGQHLTRAGRILLPGMGQPADLPTGPTRAFASTNTPAPYAPRAPPVRISV